jgi:hypothetical protein
MTAEYLGRPSFEIAGQPIRNMARAEPRQRNNYFNFTRAKWVIVLILPLVVFVIPQGGPCHIPSLSKLSICGSPEPPQTFNITLLNQIIHTQQRILPQLLGATNGDKELAYVVKEADNALYKFNNDVRRSNLPSKEHISAAITTVMKKSRKIASDLQRFASESTIVTAKARIFNKEMYLQISAATQQTLRISAPNDILGYAVQLANTYLSPTQQPRSIQQWYLDLTKKMPVEIQKLRHRASAIQQNLFDLDENVDLINSLGLADEGIVDGERKRTLRTIWYKIGGHREKVGDLEKGLRLIENLFHFLAEAKDRVGDVLLKLDEMDVAFLDLEVGMEEMQFVDPNLIDLKIHLEQIQATVDILERAMNHQGTLAAREYDIMMGL